MKSYNPKGPKSIAKSVKGNRALHEGDNSLIYNNFYHFVTANFNNTKNPYFHASTEVLATGLVIPS